MCLFNLLGHTGIHSSIGVGVGVNVGVNAGGHFGSHLNGGFDNHVHNHYHQHNDHFVSKGMISKGYMADCGMYQGSFQGGWQGQYQPACYDGGMTMYHSTNYNCFC